MCKTCVRRVGNKKKLLNSLLGSFPQKIDTFVDLFMGSGTVTLAMAKRAPYVIANDNDQDVFNFFMVLKERKEELTLALEKTPVHESLFLHWGKNEETDPVWKAVRFIMLNNFGLYWNDSTFKMDAANNSKRISLDRIEECYLRVQNVVFCCCDFRDFFKKYSEKWAERRTTFVYADPPYCETNGGTYAGFKQRDTLELFELLCSSGKKFAVSEFWNDFIVQTAKDFGFNVIRLGERQTLKNRNVEVLICNYNPVMPLFA